MTYDKKMLAAREIWQKGLATLSATRRQTLQITLLGLILPDVMVSLILDVQSAATVNELRSIFTAKSGGTGSYAELLGPSVAYASRFGILIFLIFLFFIASYAALVHTAVDHWRGIPPRGMVPVWWAGVKTLPRALLLIFTLMLLLGVGQVLVAPAILIAVLSLIVPVIMIAERKGLWSALWQALTLKYAKQSVYAGWGILLNLMSFGALVYGLLLGTSFLAQRALFLDEYWELSRSVWTLGFPGLDFGPVYLLVSIVETCVVMAITACIPAITTALYFLVVPPRELGRY